MEAAGATFSTTLRVRFGETDAMGVANNAAYLQYFEIGRIEYLRWAGHSYAEVHDGGMDMVVAEASIRYLRPLRFDDVCALLRRLGLAERQRGGTHHIFTRDGVAEILKLQPSGGGSTKPYQVRQVRDVVLRSTIRRIDLRILRRDASDEMLVSRFRSSYPWAEWISRVRRQNRSIETKISSADFVHRRGLGLALCRSI